MMFNRKNGSRTGWLAVVVIFLVGGLVAPPPAAASDHAVPRAILKIDDDRQMGSVYDSQWIAPDSEDERFCSTTFESSLNRFPRRTLVFPESVNQGRIRIRKPTRPTEVLLQAWKKVDSKRRPTGDPTAIPFMVSPHIVDNETRAWDITFILPTSTSIYLEIEAGWSDEEGCVPPPDIGSQYVIWRFHARRR